LVGVGVTLQARMGQVFGSNLGQDIGYPEFFHGFIQSLQVNAMMVAQLGHGCFIPVLPNHYSSIILEFNAIHSSC
jgi:hypothetical protein